MRGARPIIPVAYRTGHYPPLDGGLSDRSFGYFKDAPMDEILKLWESALTATFIGLFIPVTVHFAGLEWNPRVITKSRKWF